MKIWLLLLAIDTKETYGDSTKMCHDNQTSQLPSNIKSEPSFKRFKEYIKIWFEPKCKRSNYMMMFLLILVKAIIIIIIIIIFYILVYILLHLIMYFYSDFDIQQ